MNDSKIITDRFDDPNDLELYTEYRDYLDIEYIMAFLSGKPLVKNVEDLYDGRLFFSNYFDNN